MNKKLLSFLLFFLCTVSAACLFFGSSALSVSDLISNLFVGNMEAASVRIFLYVRIPRVIAPLMAGACLSMSGVILQALFQNPLAAPNVIGVNAGAGFAVVCLYAFLPTLTQFVPLAAFLGAVVVSFGVFSFACSKHTSNTTLVLAGVAISGILNAGIDAIVTLVPDALPGINAFKIGGFLGISMQSIWQALPLTVVGITLALLFSYELNILRLGAENAASLGLPVRRYRGVFLLLAAALAGTAVSLAGLLGFVGLIAPHIVRRFAGEDHRTLLPASAMVGGIFVLLCDTIARTAFAPFEISVGILLSLIGGGFFLYLIVERGHKHDRF